MINPHMLAIDFPIEGYNSILHPPNAFPTLEVINSKTNG